MSPLIQEVIMYKRIRKNKRLIFGLLKKQIVLFILKGAEDVEESRLQWHPAFRAAMRVELEESREYLEFYEEFNLSKKPLEIDILIIKKKKEHRKNLDLKKDIEPLAEEYRENKDSPDYQAIMDLILRANRNVYEKETSMCEAILELFADETAKIRQECEMKLRKAKEEGVMLALVSVVRKKMDKGLNVEMIADLLEEKEELIQKIYETIEHNREKTNEEIVDLI